jgi:hypothetical protein
VNFILIPGIVPVLTEIVLYSILYAIIIYLILPTNNYQPYKPRARWRKKVDRWCYNHIEAPLTQQICSISSRIYLYLQDDRKKREQNRKKGRQKKQHNYNRAMRAKVLMLQLISIQNQNVLASQVYTKYRSLSSSHCAPYLNTKTSICLQANQSQTTEPQKVSFDSDSFEILVDNGASRSITNNKKDFIDTPRLVRTLIEGYSGTSEASLIGTVKWTIADDQGLEHNIILSNTILDEKAKMRILSPQH